MSTGSDSSAKQPNFTTVKVRVVAGASKEEVLRSAKGLRIKTKEPAEGNRANAQVAALVAKEYGVARAKVRLVGGHHAPSKTFTIFL